SPLARRSEPPATAHHAQLLQRRRGGGTEIDVPALYDRLSLQREGREVPRKEVARQIELVIVRARRPRTRARPGSPGVLRRDISAGRRTPECSDEVSRPGKSVWPEA